MSEEVTPGTIKIMTSSSEKIGLPNYSSVDVGPISITRFIPEGDDDYLKEALRHNLELVEEVIAEIRQQVLDAVQDAKK